MAKARELNWILAVLAMVWLGGRDARAGVTRVAVLPFLAAEPGGAMRQDVLLTEFSDRVAAELARAKSFQVVERDKVIATTKQASFGVCTGECALKIGKLLSADWVVLGTLATTSRQAQGHL